MILSIDFHCISQAELALIFGKTGRTIQNWHYYGLPRHGEGRGCYYVWAEVLPWYLNFAAACDIGDTSVNDGKPKFTKTPSYGPNYFQALDLVERLRKALTGGVKEDLPRPRTRKPKKRKPQKGKSSKRTQALD
jgi:hypothetical protein